MALRETPPLPLCGCHDYIYVDAAGRYVCWEHGAADSA
jgi:hypothetical protein